MRDALPWCAIASAAAIVATLRTRAPPVALPDRRSHAVCSLTTLWGKVPLSSDGVCSRLVERLAKRHRAPRAQDVVFETCAGQPMQAAPLAATLSGAAIRTSSTVRRELNFPSAAGLLSHALACSSRGAPGAFARRARRPQDGPARHPLEGDARDVRAEERGDRARAVGGADDAASLPRHGALGSPTAPPAACRQDASELGTAGVATHGKGAKRHPLTLRPLSLLTCSALTSPRGGVQDPSNHPLWTGREVTEIKEESRAAKFLDRFGDVTGARSPGGGSRDGRETA